LFPQVWECDGGVEADDVPADGGEPAGGVALGAGPAVWRQSQLP